jgi:carbon storage regulator
MLVLSRKLGESIEIGDKSVIIRVLGIKRSKVQLGIDAPPEIAVHRSEKAALFSEVNVGDWSSATAPDGHGIRVDADSLLDDLLRVQAEIAVLAELVPDAEQMVARQVALEASERLSSIERAVRFLRNDVGERPIGSFIEAHSNLLGESPVVDEPTTEKNAGLRRWQHQRGTSGRLVRESSPVFELSKAPCSLA